MARFQQEKILYTREWTSEVDTTFIKKLELEAAEGRLRTKTSSMAAIRLAMEEVNTTLGKSFTFDKCCDQFQKLRRRYKVYSDILNHPGVSYDPTTNSVAYEMSAWEQISKTDPLAVAYRHKGDPELAAFRKIFCDEDDSVGFFDLQDITHLSSNLLGLSDPERYQYPRYGFDDRVSNSFWSYVALPSSQGECNTSSSAYPDGYLQGGLDVGPGSQKPTGGSEGDKSSAT